MILLKKKLVAIVCFLFVFIFFSSIGNSLVKLKETSKFDKYGWMETESEQIDNWLLSETDRSIKILDNLPDKLSIDEQLNSLTDSTPRIWGITYAGDSCFYFMWTSEFPYNRLFVKNSLGQETLLIDPSVGYGIYFFSPSYDGKLILYGLSENGSESSSLKIVNVKTGEELQDTIYDLYSPSIVWGKDNASFFYTKKSQSKTRQGQPIQEVYLHHLGMSIADDRLIFGVKNISNVDSDMTENVSLSLSLNSNWMIASGSSSITGYSSDLYLSRYDSIGNKEINWLKIIDINQNVSQFIIKDKWLYLARYNPFSGYTISRLNLDTVNKGEEKILEWKNGELIHFGTSLDSLYIAYHESGNRRFIQIPFSDINNIKNIPISRDCEVTELFISSDRKDILFTLESWIKPPKIFIYDPDTQMIKDSNIINSTPYSLEKYEFEEKWVASKDGVNVPLTIIHRKDLKLDSLAPTWLTAYGAYGVSELPNFNSSRLIWLERGGILAIAHIRGGGELGPEWHNGGKGKNKKNSVIDFINCAEYLVKENYTNPSKLVISGGSAGGIVIGMAIIHRPELFAAAAIEVGILNISRLDKIPIGAVNFKEFGSPFNKQERNDLLQIDAYLNLRDNVTYPAVILSVGLKDERVSPWQTAKFAARLKEINGKNPTLILADKDAGHFLNNFPYILDFFIWRIDSSK